MKTMKTKWLPMPLKRGAGMLSLSEWRAYRTRRAKHLLLNEQYDHWWRRPARKVAGEVWALLAAHGLTFAEFATSISARLSPDEQRELDGTLQQALTIAVEAFVTAGRDEYLLTVNRLFDGLASGWSDHYRAVKQAGLADRARDMKPDTIKAARRDLLRNGIDVLAIWQTLTREWSDERGGNPLFWTTFVTRRTEHGQVTRACEVHLKDGPALERFKAILIASAKHEQTRHGWTLLPAADVAPALEPEWASCHERPYNRVTSGATALKAIDIQAHARLVFNTEAFLSDYDTPDADPNLRIQYRGARDELRRRGISGDIVVKSRFARLVNRRFSAVDVWPMHVPAKEEPWREVIPAKPDGPGSAPGWRTLGNPVALGVVSSPRGRWFRFQDEDPEVERDIVGALYGVDVSSSQTAILAVLLGLDKLEEIASSKSFNQFLAERAWQKRQRWLKPGYEGSTDARLVLLVKQFWMRVLYGAPPAWTVLRQWDDTTDVGPGWASAPAAALFLKSIPQYRQLSKFLEACRLIAERVDLYHGFEFTDLLDGEAVRWNPVQRADTVVSSHGLKILVRRPGRVVSHKEREDWEPRGAGRPVYRFVPNKPDPETGDFPIDREELSAMLAPCFVHALDAALAGRVILALDAAGAQNIISIHDAWFAQLPDAEAFDAALAQATEAWFRALGPAYDDLARELPNGALRKLILDARSKWQDRVAVGRWPRFHLKPDTPISDLTEAK